MRTISPALSLALLLGGAWAAEAPSKIIEVQKEVEKNGKQALARVGGEFEAAVKLADLSPSTEVRANVKAVRETSSKLLSDLNDGKFGHSSVEAKAVSSAIRAALGKLDSVIEEDYEEQPGIANVSPPAGTPNAAPGMSPDAISDPKLREQYLTAIESEKKKQQKNVQQREAKAARKLILMQVSSLGGFRKEELISQFTSEGKSRELLAAKISNR